MLRTGAIWTVTITNMSENPIEMSFSTTARENKVFATNRKSAKKCEHEKEDKKKAASSEQ